MRAEEFLTENKVVAVRPNQLTTQQQVAVANFISQGGEVSAANAIAGVQRAQLIGYATNDEGKIIAVSALKTPLDSYKNKVFTAAGQAELARQYQYEKGYSYTDPKYRRQGLNRSIWEKLASGSGRVFATTRSDNLASKNNLVAQGFSQLGQPWSSSRGDYTIELWVNG